jgi:transcriptional regulator with XRE-family HTH domain
MVNLARRIAEARRSAGLTQTELADKLGVSENAVQTWEAGTFTPRPKRLHALAEALGKPVSWFLADAPDADAQLDRLADLYLSEALDLATIERRAQPLRAEKARLESSAVDAGPVNVGLWRAMERLGGEGLLVNIREGPLEGQAEFLRSVYSRVELLPGKRVVFHAQGLPPVERVLPRYYSEARGVTDIGF